MNKVSKDGFSSGTVRLVKCPSVSAHQERRGFLRGKASEVSRVHSQPRALSNPSLSIKTSILRKENVITSLRDNLTIQSMGGP